MFEPVCNYGMTLMECTLGQASEPPKNCGLLPEQSYTCKPISVEEIRCVFDDI